MYKKILLIFLFYLFAFNIFALELKKEFKIGVTSQCLSEKVFSSDKQISKLNYYDTSPELGVSFNFSNRVFSFGLDAHFSAPFCFGFLEDFDYLGSDEKITNYSYHNIMLDNKFNFNIYAGKIIVEKNNFGFEAGLGFNFTNTQISAYDGYYQYPSTGEWSGDEDRNQMIGNVITIRQYKSAPYIYTRFSFINNDFSFTFGYSPHTIIRQLDSHYVRLKQYYDEILSGQDFSLGVSYSFFGFKILLKANYTISGLGVTKYSTIGEGNSTYTDIQTNPKVIDRNVGLYFSFLI